MTKPHPSPTAQKKNANRLAERSSMKWQIISHAAAMRANAPAILARWKATISGRGRVAAGGPITIQNMNRYAAGPDSVGDRLGHPPAPSHPWPVLAPDVMAASPR